MAAVLDPSKAISLSEAARRLRNQLGVGSAESVRNYVDGGQLLGAKVAGRRIVDADSLSDFIAKRRRGDS